MLVTINDEQHQLPSPCTVADMVTQLGLDTKKIALERNLTIIPRSQYGETLLCEGDRIEIVHFIGGG